MTRAQLDAALAETAAGPGDAALVRVLSLDRRRPLTPDEIEVISAAFRLHAVCPAGPGTEDEPCRRCGGTGWIRMLPAQAEAIREMFDLRGLFGGMGVGSGKTLVSLLAATLFQARCPALMIPANLRPKTQRDFAFYLQDWRVRLPRIISYTEAGRPDRAPPPGGAALVTHPRTGDVVPDLLILDEADDLRNLDAAAARRVHRFAMANPHVPVIAMSGTLIGESLMDSWHHAVWALGERAPVPTQRAEAERWAAAVDNELGSRRPVGPGALGDIPGGFHAWLRGSRGVVAVHGSDCDASISIAPWSPPLPPELAKLIAWCEREKKRPDGEPLDDLDLPETLCMLAQGYFQIWQPMPPDWWLQPRRAWAMYVNAVLEARLDAYDSTAPIVNALDGGYAMPEIAPKEGAELLARWRAVRDSFVPNPVPVWLDRDPLRRVVEHARGTKTIVWCGHVPPGEELQKLGLPYYGAGNDPEGAPPGRPMCCSVDAHHKGKNLQAWDRMLFLEPMASARRWEQAIGREHRRGQRSPHIGIEYLSTIDYHERVMERVAASSRKISRGAGFPQKLTLADWL